MTSSIPQDLHYSSSHEWARQEKDGSITFGITDHAQCLLGDIVFVELPSLNTSFKSGQESAVIESVKAAADVYCPIEGEIIAINDDVVKHPELVNTAPYDAGWLFRIRPKQTDALNTLMNAQDYEKHIQ